VTDLATPIARPAPAPPDEPRRVVESRRQTRSWGNADLGELLGSAASAAALVWLLFARLTSLEGAVGFVVMWFVVFVATYWLVCRGSRGPLVARDRLWSVVVHSGAFLVFGTMAVVIGYVIFRGLEALRPNFFTETMEFAGPLDPLSVGGGFHAIIGTVQQVLLATVLCVPLAILTAIHLNEIGGRMARVVRVLVDAMSGIPSVVAGLFVLAIWIRILGNGFSGFAATLALSILMLPIVTRTAEEMLRLVPGGLREAALALGSPEWRVALRVVVPTARTGLVTAAVLGAARVVGETAPVLLTAFGSSVLNANLFDEPQQTLSLLAYQLIRRFQENDQFRAWAAALTLLIVVLVLFVLARLIAGRDPTREKRRVFRRSMTTAVYRVPSTFPTEDSP
jgi:phosphate transport system permease protein